MIPPAFAAPYVGIPYADKGRDRHGTVLEQIRTVAGIPQVVMDVVLASSPDVVEAGPFDFALMSATYDVMTITGVLGYMDEVLNQKVPCDEYTPTNSPGLFL